MDSDEELDVICSEEDKIYKAAMSQVICYRCNRLGHFSHDCKRLDQRRRSNGFSTKGKPNNSIFTTTLDAHRIDEKSNELYAYDYDDDRTYSLSNSDNELEQTNLMYLTSELPKKDFDALFTDYEDDAELHLKA